MATITIDGKEHDVELGQNLLHVCLSLKIDLPYFCWHPALGSVGACRQCAVKQFKDENDTRGRITMACMTPAEDGMRISVNDPEAREFRAAVIEWLMVNHPHDCPVCDEGGECHLQDMTVMTGHTYRAFRFDKRTHRNQNLGPLVNHEMNRCIACYRCVRFYRDYAGGRDLDVFGAHDRVYFGRAADGVLESEFSGNLVEVCPTGVFTDKTLKRHYTRKWDLQTAPSICVHCGTGCNTIPGARYGTLRRIRNRYHSEINGYFLCDRGRYGYEFVNSSERIRRPALRHEETGDVLARIAPLLADRSKIIGIGSPRATLEANFALRALVGPERFFDGMSAADRSAATRAVEIFSRGTARAASLRDAEQCDAVLILGEDVASTAPRLALALRQSARRKPLEQAEKLKIPLWNDAAVREVIQDRNGPFYIATPYATRLDDAATRTYHAAPAELARLGFAVAQELDGAAPDAPDLSEDARALAAAIAQALKDAKRPLVVTGAGCGDAAVIDAAANVSLALRRGRAQGDLCVVMPECNTLGAALMTGRSLEDAFAAVHDGRAETVIVLENDLYRRADRARVDAFFAASQHVIALDSLPSRTTERAEAVLPAATFAESSGTLVNYEGRAQRFYAAFAPAGEIKESWRWLRDLGLAAGAAEPARWQNLDAVGAALAAELAVFQPISAVAPSADFRLAGQKIRRQPHRYSGRTAIHAARDVSEPKPPDDPDAPLAFSMEGYSGQPPPALIPFFWAPGWNSAQAVTKFQAEVNGELRGGHPGKRLIEAGAPAMPNYFRDVPQPFSQREGFWLVVAIHHVFGSEELSACASAIAQLAPRAYIGLSAGDAAELDVRPGQTVELNLAGAKHSLPLELIPGLPKGVAGIPAGVPPLTGIALPAWAELSASPG